MNDLDAALRADAQDWIAAQPAPPDLHRAVEAAVAGPAVPANRSVRHALVLAGSIAAVALVALGVATLSGSTHRVRPPSAAAGLRGVPTAVRSGHAVLPFAGYVPWADAVADPSDPRVLYVYADSDRMQPGVCGVPTESVHVTSTTSTVTVRVAGYAAPLPTGVVCAGVGHAPQRQRVALPAPLAGRRLIDGSDGAIHQVLDPASVPAITRLPAGFTADPVQWDEKSGIVERGYTAVATGPDRLTMILFVGTPAAITAGVPPDGAYHGTVTVGGAAAKIWHYADPNNDSTILRWSPRPGQTMQLTTYGEPAHHLSQGELLAVARSVH